MLTFLGMITKKLLEKIKEVSPSDFESMKSVDKKSLNSKVADQINLFVETIQILK